MNCSDDDDEMNLCVTCLAFSHDSKIIAWGDLDKKVSLVTIPGLDQIAVFRHDGDVKSVAFSPCSLIVAGGGGTDRMHGLMDNKSESAEMKTVIWTRPTLNSDEQWKRAGTIVSREVVTCVEFSPDGKYLAISSEDRKIEFMTVSGGFKKHGEMMFAGSVLCIAWTSCSEFLASGETTMEISITHVATLRQVNRIPGFQDWICSLSFSPDMTKLAVATHHPTVNVFTLKNKSNLPAEHDLNDSTVTKIIQWNHFSEDGGKIGEKRRGSRLFAQSSTQDTTLKHSLHNDTVGSKNALNAEADGMQADNWQQKGTSSGTVEEFEKISGESKESCRKGNPESNTKSEESSKKQSIIMSAENPISHARAAGEDSEDGEEYDADGFEDTDSD